MLCGFGCLLIVSEIDFFVYNEFLRAKRMWINAELTQNFALTSSSAKTQVSYPNWKLLSFKVCCIIQVWCMGLSTAIFQRHLRIFFFVIKFSFWEKLTTKFTQVSAVMYTDRQHFKSIYFLFIGENFYEYLSSSITLHRDVIGDPWKFY